MKKSVVILLHVGFWFCYLALILVILGALYGDNGATSEARISNAFQDLFFFVLVPSALTFYSFYYYLFPQFLQKNRYLAFFILSILIALAAALINYFILNTINADRACGNEDDDIATFFGATLFMTFVSYVSGVISLVIKGFITWFEEVKLRESLMQKNHEMEMALVKSQLDPHFLFNTINNIDVLILKNAEEASDYLNNLSDIMRFMLFETKSAEIQLSQEIEYLHKYIELQKIRTSNTTYVNFKVTGSLEGKTIAPMVFISFVENAFKHTNNKKTENAITIDIIIEKESIILNCANKYDPKSTSSQDSHGLGNVLIQKRLNLIYPDKHTLKISNENGLYSVQLIIQHG